MADTFEKDLQKLCNGIAPIRMLVAFTRVLSGVPKSDAIENVCKTMLFTAEALVGRPVQSMSIISKKSRKHSRRRI